MGEAKQFKFITVLYFQLADRVADKEAPSKSCVENSTQCDGAPEEKEKDVDESTFEALKQEYEENLHLAKEHMAAANQESLSMLNKNLEEDYNKLMKIMEDGLQKGFEESIFALTKAHEEEVSELLYSLGYAEVSVAVYAECVIFIRPLL